MPSKRRSRQRVLFLLKVGHDYMCGYSHTSTSGLRNSARFVSEMLKNYGFKSTAVEVNDNNDIDRETFEFQPTHVVIEALWVVPPKFDELAKLHPKVKWIVRSHSDWTFLGTEGIAVEWIKQYLKNPNVSVAFNSPRIVRDLKEMFPAPEDQVRILYLPNFYPVPNVQKDHHLRGELRVCNFGAIRPMKNQLLQAVGAIRYADQVNKDLRYYVNATRCEQLGDNALKNMQALFAGTRHTLVEMPWINDHDEFLDKMAMMDVSLNVSLTETFCIVAADAVACGVPLICSNSVPWASKMSIVDTLDSGQIMDRMAKLTGKRARAAGRANRANLVAYSNQSRGLWIDYLSQR